MLRAMQRVPSPTEVRALVAPLDEQDRKVLGGLCAWMMAEPARIRDREWLAQRFVEVAVVARCEDDGASATTADVELVRSYAATRMPDLLVTAVALFVRTAEDLRSEGIPATMERANAIVRDYLQP